MAFKFKMLASLKFLIWGNKQVPETVSPGKYVLSFLSKIIYIIYK